ncbi:MAG: Ig-like domain-containing protein, partial [Methylobacter sp.]
GAEVTAAPYSLAWDTATVLDGNHSLTAVARDAAGNTATSSIVSVTVNNPVVDTTLPTVSMIAPASGASVSGSVPVSADAADNIGVVGVQFQMDGVNLDVEDTTAPYSVSWNTTAAANGNYTLTAVAKDAAGNQTTSGSVSVTVNNPVVDTILPTVSLTAPANGASVSGSVPVSADAADNIGVVGVQFQLDGANLGAEVTAAPYSLAWDTTTVLDGSHSLTAVARDAAGNTATSSIVSVTVNNPVADTILPTVSLTAPASGASVSGSVPVSADAADNIGIVGVQFKLDGVNLDVEDTTAPYSVSWNTTAAANGNYTLTAVARDAAGNQTSSGSISATVNNPSVTNLTHQWKFDEISGATALDSAGTNNATLTNSLWVAGKAGNAASFNGTNSSGNAGKIDFGMGDFTVAHWVKVNGFKNYAGIFNNRSSASGNIGFQTRTDGTSTFTALIDFGAASKNLAVTKAVIGTWYHIAVSVDRAGLMKLYVNGAIAGQVDISAFSTINMTNADNVRLGRSQSSDYFNGAIDDLRVYNSVLSAAEILNIYNQ